MDFFWYHFNITIVIVVQGSFSIGPIFKIHDWLFCYFNFERGYQNFLKVKMEVHIQYCNDPLSSLSKSSSESIIMIPEKVHKTYYKMIFKKYTTKG